MRRGVVAASELVRKAGTLEIVSKQKCGLVTATNAAQHPHLSEPQIYTDFVNGSNP